MNVSELARYFNVAHTTIAKWLVEFADYLSHGATREETTEKTFSEDDLSVLATIARLSKQRKPYGEIHKALKTGERVEFTDARYGMDTQVLPRVAVDSMLDATALRTELDRAKMLLDQAQARIAELEAQRDKHAQHVEDLQSRHMDKIESLLREIAELKAQVATAEGELKHLKPKE